jgi:hypothetical protein
MWARWRRIVVVRLDLIGANAVTSENQNVGKPERRNTRMAGHQNHGNTRTTGTPEPRIAERTEAGHAPRAPSQKTQKTLKVRPATSRDFLVERPRARTGMPEVVPISKWPGARRRHCQASPFCAFARGSGRSARSAIRGSRSSVVLVSRRSGVPSFWSSDVLVSDVTKSAALRARSQPRSPLHDSAEC